MWIHQTGTWTNHLCETRNAECHSQVNRFTEWIQAFWRFLNQNWAFSHSANIHHFHEFWTSCWKPVAQWPSKKGHTLYDENDANFALPFFSTKILDNNIVLNANKFQVFRTMSFPFRPFFPQISSQTRKSDFAKQKLSIKKRLTFFSHIRHESLSVDNFLKEFSKTFKILLFLWIPNDSSLLRSKAHLSETYFRKIYFPTIRRTALHLIHIHLSWTHSSKEAALVLDDCKMPVFIGHEQLS